MKLVDCTAVLRRRPEICILGNKDPLHNTYIVVRYQCLKTNKDENVSETNPGQSTNRLREAKRALVAKEMAAWDAGDRSLARRPDNPNYYTIVNWYEEWLKIERIDIDDQMKVLKA